MGTVTYRVHKISGIRRENTLYISEMCGQRWRYWNNHRIAQHVLWKHLYPAEVFRMPVCEAYSGNRKRFVPYTA